MILASAGVFFTNKFWDRPVSSSGRILDRVLRRRVLKLAELRAQVEQLRRRVEAAEEIRAGWKRDMRRLTHSRRANSHDWH